MSQESDNVQDASLPWMTKLKNRMMFKVDQLVNDPVANHFARQRAPSVAATSTKATPDNNHVAETYEDTEAEDKEDPTEGISVNRIMKKTWKYLKLVVENAFYPVLALIVASYVANEMIVFPPPMRFAAFVFIMVLSIVMHPIALGLAFYYACKKGYSYYVNDMENGPKRRIMPPIFALLPLTTYQYESGFASVFMYPFTYPKTEEDERELPLIMADYYRSLESSFGYLKKVANLPFFAEGIKKIKSQMEHMHDKKFPPPPEEQTAEEVPLPPVLTETTGPVPSTVEESQEQTQTQTQETLSSEEKSQEQTPSAPPLPPVIPSQQAEEQIQQAEEQIQQAEEQTNETSKANQTVTQTAPTNESSASN